MTPSPIATASPGPSERPHRSEAVAPCALVTGAARRLGRDIALGLARDGWDVAVHYGHSQAEALETVRDIEALGRRALAVPADLADEAQVRQLFDTARVGLGGRLGLIVNSASRFEFDTPQDFGFAAMAQHMAPNLSAPVVLTRLLHESLGEEDCGVVLHLLDQKLENLNPDFFSYTLSKAALLTAMRLCAQAFAPRLRVLAVSPGITLPSGDQTDAGFEAAHRRTPLGASSRPQDIVDAVIFLARARAISGVNLPVDGAQHLLPLPRDVMYLVPADTPE